MKYPDHTISRPVTGSTADALVKAVDGGGHMASPKAVEMMHELYRRHAQAGGKPSNVTRRTVRKR